MTADYSDIEREVLTLTAGEALSLTQSQVDRLLTDPAYRSSLGTPAHATHFRRALADGRGLHLVVTTDGVAALHWDRFDPQASPASLALHLLTDAPQPAVSLFAAGAAVLRRLGSR